MYLWLNLSDIFELGTIGSLGSPLNLLLQEGELLPGHWSKQGGGVDEVYLVVECTTYDRVVALKDALEVIGKRKLGRNVRTRVTVRKPGKHWRHQWTENFPQGTLEIIKYKGKKNEL